ncbi:hypothetical protein AAHC03_013922 [Spirometra sp. Aus1]
MEVEANNVDKTAVDAEETEFQPSQQDIALVVAACAGDLEEVKHLVEEDADVCFQDLKTGMSVLMAAAGAGHVEVVRYLLQVGAPWNAVDRMYRCAGDYAAKNGHQAVVDLIMDHAVMSEMLLSIAMSNAESATKKLDRDVAQKGSNEPPTETPLNAAYLASRLEYSPAGDRLVDTSTQLAVMMSWEKPLMAQHADWICHAVQSTSMGGQPLHRPDRLRTLNVGFGMGIVDEEIMKHAPDSHVIIEAHPQVLEKMREDGWMDRPEVQVRCGRWQDVLPELARAIEAGEMAPFDGVFFDTYAEDDRDLNNFHQFLPRIMSQHPRARYSYYNGMCPDNVFFHGVACETTRLHLERLGFTCEFLAVPVKCVAEDKLWENLSSRYWLFDTYFLPQCTRRPVNE